MSCVVNVCVLNAILLYLTRWNVKKKNNSSGKKCQSYKTNCVFWEELSGVLISTAKIKTKKKCCENTSEKSVACCWMAPSASLPLCWISYSSSPAISRDVFLVIISCDRSSLRYDGTVAPQFFFTLYTLHNGFQTVAITSLMHLRPADANHATNEDTK